MTDGVGNLQQICPACAAKVVPAKATVNSINRVIVFIMAPLSGNNNLRHGYANQR